MSTRKIGGGSGAYVRSADQLTLNERTGEMETPGARVAKVPREATPLAKMMADLGGPLGDAAKALRPTPESLTVTILRGARERVARGWTQRIFARDNAGLPVASYSKEAVCWSLAGGVMAAWLACGVPGAQAAYEAALRALRTEAGGDCEAWADAHGRTQAEVLALLDRACAAEGGAK